MEVLRDPHLPISEKEREIICSLFGIYGFSTKSLEELSKIYGDTVPSIRRRYIRACANILKYKNKEIEGKINYDIDILPNLKYFSNSYRVLIEEFYGNNLTYEKITKKYNLTINQVINIFGRIKEELYEMINNPKEFKFDFDFYEKNRNNSNLPFYGDISVIDKVFRLFFGMDDIKRKSCNEIIKELNLSYAPDQLSRIINCYMLAFCKLKDGITKTEDFSYDEVKEHYDECKDEMPDYIINMYLGYFRKTKNGKYNYYRRTSVNDVILYDMLKEKSNSYFDVQNATRQEVMQILKKYNNRISCRIRNVLMRRFDIKGKEFMSGKEINHLYKILDKLDKQILIEKPHSYVKALNK